MKRVIYCLFVMLFCSFFWFACNDSKEPTESSSSSSSVTSEVKEPNIYFVENEITLSVGQTVKAEIVTSKNNVFVFWTIRDADLAIVSNDGEITALAIGETICYAEFMGEKVMCLVKITEQQAKPMLSLSVPYSEEGVTVYVGDSLAIKAIVKLGDTTVDSADVEYTVDQTEIIRVEEGKVVGVAAGTATLTITATYEGQTALMTLTVNVVEM